MASKVKLLSLSFKLGLFIIDKSFNFQNGLANKKKRICKFSKNLFLKRKIVSMLLTFYSTLTLFQTKLDRLSMVIFLSSLTFVIKARAWAIWIGNKKTFCVNVICFILHYWWCGLFSYFWLLLATFGYFWLLLATFGYFWLLLATFGYFLSVFVYFWLILAIFGYFCWVLYWWIRTEPIHVCF